MYGLDLWFSPWFFFKFTPTQHMLQNMCRQEMWGFPGKSRDSFRFRDHQGSRLGTSCCVIPGATESRSCWPKLDVELGLMNGKCSVPNMETHLMQGTNAATGNSNCEFPTKFWKPRLSRLESCATLKPERIFLKVEATTAFATGIPAHAEMITNLFSGSGFHSDYSHCTIDFVCGWIELRIILFHADLFRHSEVEVNDTDLGYARNFQQFWLVSRPARNRWFEPINPVPTPKLNPRCSQATLSPFRKHFHYHRGWESYSHLLRASLMWVRPM